MTVTESYLLVLVTFEISAIVTLCCKALNDWLDAR